ncbi:hypothetical protein MMC27_007451 [Xylographa pallens]|nr:hypothetical protein [Xylographa pallens]
MTTLTGPTTQIITATEFCDQNLCPLQTGTDTATWTLPCSATEGSTTLSITPIATIQTSIGPNPTSNTLAETSRTISEASSIAGDYIQTVIITESGLQVLWVPKTTALTYNFDEPDNYLTVNGPTTVTVTARYSSKILPEAYAYTATYTQTVDEGTLTDDVVVGTTVSDVTLIGPTTYVATVTKLYDNGIFGDLFAGFDSADPQCTHLVTDSWQSELLGHTVLLKTQVGILSEGETLTKECTDGIVEYSETMRNYTFTTAGTAYCTFAQFLAAWQYERNELYLTPGNRCGGGCGQCQLYFPEVNVYYWPPASANTACLSTNSTATFTPGNRRRGLRANLRALSDVPVGVTTTVNSNGFTFTSPSAYIAIATISAYDDCGVIGDAHTSVTLGYAPGQLSTFIFGGGAETLTSSFDFADAQCLPASLSDQTYGYTVVGHNGEYNPVISPPADLTLLDPKWNVNCLGAAFQGVDPPFALVPQSVLVPNPTPVSPVVTITPAIPSSSIPAVPIQTGIPKTSTMFSPQTAIDPGMNPQPSTSTAPAMPPHQSPSLDPPVSIDLPPQTSASDSSIPKSGSNTAGSGQSDPNSSADGPQSTPVALPPGSNNPLSTPSTSANLPPESLTPAPAPPTPIVIASQTLTPGRIIIISGTTISLDPTLPSLLVIDATTTFPLPILAASPSQPAQIITLAGHSYTVDPIGYPTALTLAGQTLTPGGTIIVSGTPVALAPSASYLVLGGTSTIPLPGLPFFSPGDTSSVSASAAPAVFTLDGHTYTESASRFIVGSQILTDGGAITVAGTVVSLASGGGDVVVGTSTQGLGLGGIILSPFGGGLQSTTTRVVGTGGVGVPFEGRAVGKRGFVRGGLACGVAAWVVFVGT